MAAIRSFKSTGVTIDCERRPMHHQRRTNARQRGRLFR